VLQPFHYAFVQRGLFEVLLLSVGAGLLGTWIVLRGLAFYSHAVATAAFPGLVLADGLAFSAPLGAFAAALLFALGVGGLARGRRSGYDTLTALVLVGSLALGVILASDVFHSGSNVESLLFGSLLLIGRTDLVLAGAVSALVLAAGFVLGRRWLATGFDAGWIRAAVSRSLLPDAALLLVIALGIVSALAAVGALLVTALVVVPAATVRLVTGRLLVWQIGAVALTAVEGVVGLWLSVEANVPPGAAIAVLGGGVFAAVAAGRVLGPRVRRGAIVPAAAAAALLLAGCGTTGSSSSHAPQVVATTTQIGDWVRAVGGSDVTVHQILQPNTDPHEYEPRPADVEAAASARLVFENGDRLDAWMGKVLSQSGGHPGVVVLGDRVPVHVRGETAGPEASRFDPHWWHDPRNAEAAVAAIRAALVRDDPAHAGAYRRRAAAYLVQLQRLDRQIAACLARIPAPERKLVTNHDAFNYFAQRYAIEIVGAVIPSQTTQAQASAGQTAKLIALIRREHVRAVFPESSVSARLAHTIARETGARFGATLYGDTLGPAGSPGATYLGMERANADAIVRGLTGSSAGCGATP
jgi:zinc/manganese transport system substrate-binding protein